MKRRTFIRTGTAASTAAYLNPMGVMASVRPPLIKLGGPLYLPSRTYFSLEAMPWSFPDSADSYLRLLQAVDRNHFGVHLDPVNMITSVRDYFYNGKRIRSMFKKLGPHIRSCHAKDIILREDNYIPQLDECRPGLGYLDYRTFLKELSLLKEIPLMMEHLQTAEEYSKAAAHIRAVGKTVNVEVSSPE